MVQRLGRQATRHGQFGFLWAGYTIPEAEGQGFYSAVVAE